MNAQLTRHYNNEVSVTNSTNPIRIVASEDGYAEDVIQIALHYVRAIADKLSISEPDVILLTHTKAQLDYTTISGQLGDGVTKALRNNKPVSIPSCGQMRHATLRTMPRFARNSIIIVCYGEDELLDFVDGVKNVAGVVVIPDLKGSAENWVRRWNPLVHGQSRVSPNPLIEDKVVISALQELTRMINLSTGISHPSDKDKANEILRILKAKGHTLEAVNIKSWAIQNGWKPNHALKLEKIASKVESLKTKPNLSKYYDPHFRYQGWKANSNS